MASDFDDVQQDIERWLTVLTPRSPAYEAFRTSIVNSFQERKYSEARANQIIDEIIARARRRRS